MTDKEWIAFLVGIIACINMAEYVRVIVKRQIKAHAFSWIIWGFTQLIAGAAQLAKGGGAGAVVMIFGALPCFVIALLAMFYYGERNVTRGDSVAFVAALAAIPLWIITKNPLWAALLVTLIDLIGGFFPTIRKSWDNPHEESIFLFAIGTAAYALVIFALESYSFTTVIYPATMVIVEGALSIMLIMRRRFLGAAPVKGN